MGRLDVGALEVELGTAAAELGKWAGDLSSQLDTLSENFASGLTRSKGVQTAANSRRIRLCP
eukprot:scaffold58968_cov28-Prasinocladus_malaysianus.AAC.1